MYYVYILYSESIDRFYVGQTMNTEQRILEHNTGSYENSYTNQATDWEVFHSITCENRSLALKIEQHLKRMKSRTYFENLKSYPHISENLRAKFKAQQGL